MEETDVTKTSAESVSEFMEMEKEQVYSHFDEPIIGSQLVANEMILVVEEVAGIQVTASEALALLCDSEANTEKTDEMVDSAKSDLQHGDNQRAGEDGVMGNEVQNDG